MRLAVRMGHGADGRRTRGVQSPGSYRWWLDIETANSWESSAPNNRADLEGMTSYFRHIGAKVGIYSTASQWNPIVGTVRPGSPLYRLPDWRPGAKALAQAKKNCHLAPLTGGGTVTVTQWKTPSANSDFSCPAPPRRRKPSDRDGYSAMPLSLKLIMRSRPADAMKLDFQRV